MKKKKILYLINALSKNVIILKKRCLKFAMVGQWLMGRDVLCEKYKSSFFNYKK